MIMMRLPNYYNLPDHFPPRLMFLLVSPLDPTGTASQGSTTILEHTASSLIFGQTSPCLTPF